jgi:hypothetical protein
MMSSVIDNPVSCKVYAVIRFLQPKNMSVAEINLENVQSWVGEQMFMMKSEVVGHL